MEKGVNQYWTPQAEEHYNRLLTTCHTFAERHLTMLLRDVLKYDGRSKESKRAMAQARLRFTTATDKDLEELSKLETRMQREIPGEIPGLHRASLVAERLGQLKKERSQIRERGIKKEELECR